MDQSALIEQLFAEIKALKERVRVLENVEKENVKLRKENSILREKLSKYENPKNSGNSSIPPSKDENRPLKTKSLRESSGKKVGAQQGHEGRTLKMTESPDVVVNHVTDSCGNCGCNLQDSPLEFVGKRQVVDIPVPKPIYTEHRVYKRRCACGFENSGAYPQNVNAPISYGPNSESLIGYLFARQYMPFNRMKEFLNSTFNLPISEGGIHELLNRLVSKSMVRYEEIKSAILASTVVGADETGAKINGKKCWIWAWQNDLLTFIVPSENRGFATVEKNFVQGFENAVLVHDCWRSHLKTNAKNHQLCTAHLLRELNYFIENHKDPWAIKFRKLLLDSLKVKEKMTLENYHKKHRPKEQILRRFKTLLKQKVNEKISDLVTFQNRMTKYNDYLFNFLKYPDVPADNNGSERAIRNVKVKLKISGQFKSFGGAMNFAVLRSITDTAIKNGENILDMLFEISKLRVTD